MQLGRNPLPLVAPGALLVSLCALLASCASEPTVGPTGPPPDVQLGPVVELLPFRTSSDHVDVVVDDSGHAHVFIAAKRPQEVHHVVVSPEGAVQREPVESASSPSIVSAAFDSGNTLHLLLDGKHLVRDASKWRAADTTPWEAAGIQVQAPGFAQGKHGLLWAFTVDGKEVGTKGRWEWYAFGGAMGGVIFPWHHASQKLVLVPEAAMAEPLWYVLDPTENLDTFNAMPAVDDDRNLHVVYNASRGGMAGTDDARYARIALGPVSPAAEQPATAESIGSRKLSPLSGSQIPWFGLERTGLMQASSAVDPETGMVLIVRAHDASLALDDGKWGLPVPLPLSSYWEPKAAPAGGKAFHLMTTADKRVLYLLYADGSWSAPIELGQAGVASGSIWGALDIASDGSNRAFVVWPTTTGIVGRWVDGSGRHPAPTGESFNDQQYGAASIPEHLLDFARGQAELITPGAVTGFSAAWAAGGNGPLTKTLHDTGQWETLAAVVLKDNFGDNLRWYYLGRAAEGMGLCDAAEAYYLISKELSKSFWTRCLGLACFGLEVEEILPGRMAAVAAMRSAGNCTEPPSAL